MKHLQDVHMSYASHLAHAWRLSLILWCTDSCHGFGRTRSATKSAIPDAPLSIFNRGLAHRFGLRRWAMVSPHKAQRSVAKLAYDGIVAVIAFVLWTGIALYLATQTIISLGLLP